MSAPQAVLDELPLPLGAEASLLDALRIAIALETGLGVTIPEAAITVSSLGTRTAVEHLLVSLDTDQLTSGSD